MKKFNLLLLLNLIIAFVSLTGCNNTESTTVNKPDYGEFTADDFLMTDGSLIRNKSGKGDKVMLRGTNAGGYLVIESWMTAISWDSGADFYDHKLVTETFTRRFGKETTLELWQYYRDNYWTENDVLNCKDMGMSVIRLPFSYMSVDPAYNNVEEIPGEKYNFRILDEFIRLCSKHGIYVILDMHGAYGSQNGQDHSGETLDKEAVDFYTNEEKMSKTLDLWDALSERYKDNPGVAGYDILNEPGEKAGATSERHWEFFNKAYSRIRENNDNHIIIFESCWDGANLPSPQRYGWENIMYSFHNYSGTSDEKKNTQSMINKIDGATKMNFNVPLYMGEFNCYGNEKSWEQTLGLFNSRGWHWTSWNYKLDRTNPNWYWGWGIYYTTVEGVRPNDDSIEEIKEKWFKIDTTHETAEEMRFTPLITLKEIMTRYCSE